MVKFEQIETLLTCMKADLEIVLSREPSREILHQILDKWDNEIGEKYGISLDANIYVEDCELADKYFDHGLHLMIKDDYGQWEILE